jgi:hypothetical protein
MDLDQRLSSADPRLGKVSSRPLCRYIGSIASTRENVTSNRPFVLLSLDAWMLVQKSARSLPPVHKRISSSVNIAKADKPPPPEPPPKRARTLPDPLLIPDVPPIERKMPGVEAR